LTEEHQYTSEVTLQGTSSGISQWYLEGISLLARQIYVMNPDGSGRKRITNVPNGIWDFAWSPTENKIAYCEQGKDGKTAIVLINADGSRRQELTKMGEIRCAVGMPILQRTLDKNKTMTATKSEGGKVLIKLVGPTESIAVDEMVTGELVGVPTLTWSPDGKFIAFTGIMNGKPVIGVVDKDGKAKPVGLGYSVYWSPDGKGLLFRHDSNTTPPVTALCLVNADGTEPRKILDNESAEFGLAWFPDGKSIIFGSQRDTMNQSEIFRINAGGNGLQKIASQPNTSLSNPAVSPEGTKLTVDARSLDTPDFSLLLVDIITHQQESLGKGSHASILWQGP
jgi:Tol biopolymer transport system component